MGSITWLLFFQFFIFSSFLITFAVPLEQVVVHDFGEFYWVCIGASNTGVALYITTSDPSECLEERPDLLKGVDGPGCGKEDEGLGPEYYLERAREFEFDGVLLAW